MAESYDLIIRGGIAATPNGIAPADVAIRAATSPPSAPSTAALPKDRCPRPASCRAS
jgi:hypothetical protein